MLSEVRGGAGETEWGPVVTEELKTEEPGRRALWKLMIHAAQMMGSSYQSLMMMMMMMTEWHELLKVSPPGTILLKFQKNEVIF